MSLCQNWYCLSKTLAELEAFAYAKKTGLDVVSLCPSLVIGPLLQSTVNASSSVLVDFLTGSLPFLCTGISPIFQFTSVQLIGAWCGLTHFPIHICSIDWSLMWSAMSLASGDRLVKKKLRNFVDVRDVADALLLVYETPEASGRYVCNSHPRLVSDVIKLLKSWYPAYKYANK